MPHKVFILTSTASLRVRPLGVEKPPDTCFTTQGGASERKKPVQSLSYPRVKLPNGLVSGESSRGSQRAERQPDGQRRKTLGREDKWDFLKLGAEDKFEFRSQSRARAGGEGRAVTAYLHPLDHGKQVRGLGKRVDTESKKNHERVRQCAAASAHLSSPANWRAARAARKPRKD